MAQVLAPVRIFKMRETHIKNRPFIERLGFALQGWRIAFAIEASFRTHVVALVLVIAALLWLQPAPLWWALVAIVSALVLAFEQMNAALEKLIDRLHPERHPEVGAAKDMAAGAVLVMACAAVAVGAAMIAAL